MSFIICSPGYAESATFAFFQFCKTCTDVTEKKPKDKGQEEKEKTGAELLLVIMS
jgi:hypothetical protein